MADTVVLIPHYNNPEGLLSSLQSIVEPMALDVVVVDDGSTVKRIDEHKMQTAAPENVTLHFCYMPENRGIEYALNLGLDFIKKKEYAFIARLDCGDTCAEHRLYKQRDFLLKHPEIKLVGSFVTFNYPDNTFGYHLDLPVKDEAIRKKMFRNSMFIHPAVMFKREIFEKVPYYPTNYKAAEDFAFFFEIIKHYKAANIPQYLVKCELNPSGISISKRKTQVRSRIEIIKNYFDNSLHAYYGLLRNYAILYIPSSVFNVLKRLWVK